MARHAEGWKIVWRRGIAHVRFRHEGKRFEFSCRTTNPGEARTTGARVYAEVVAGQRRLVPDLASRSPLIDLVAEWVHSLEGVLDPGTAREYEIQASAQWLPRWKTLVEITTSEIGTYQRSRLRQVTSTTLKKELSALRGFFAWCVEQGRLSRAPEIPTLPHRTRGKRAIARRERKPITTNEMKKLLALLPVLSKPHPTKKKQERFRVRDFFVVLWETALRPATVERIAVPDHYTKGADALVLYDDADKARHDRGVPLTDAARAALDRSCPESGTIFGAHAWREYLGPAAKKVGRRIALDDFRHTQITRWLESGANIVGVQHLAGHKHLSTTARYTHPSYEAAARVLKGER